MSHFKNGSLSKETYVEWFDMIQGHAIDCGIWKFVDPSSEIPHEEPEKPIFSNYKSTAIRYADLGDDEKDMFKEDNSQYRVNIQTFKQESRMIGELRSKIVESLQPNHRKLIFGRMTCREVLRQIKNRLEPADDIQQLQIIDDYSKARIPPIIRNVDSWLMEWERLDIMIKRLKMSDFSEYKLIQDFLSTSNPLLPMWVTNKRMEILKVSDKSTLKFLDVLLELRQFWFLTDFEERSKVSAFPASLQGLEQLSTPQPVGDQKSSNQNRPRYEPGQVRPCICGNIHSGEECFYLAEGKAPSDFERNEKIVKKFYNACHRPAYRTFIRKSEWTSKWLKDYINANWPVGNQRAKNTTSQEDSEPKRSTFVTSVGNTALITSVDHPLRYEILLDNGADGHVCNNLALATSALERPTKPTYVQGGSGTTPIVGYGNMVFNANLGNGKTFEMTLTGVAFAPDFLTSVVSWKMLKKRGIKWDSDTNKMTYNGNIICQLLDRHNHDVFTL